jgi:hypothetical protein
MPNGKPLSGASGAAEFASSAIAFQDIDYSLSGGAQSKGGFMEMSLIGAPLGLVVLMALGGIVVMMSYLSE